MRLLTFSFLEGLWRDNKMEEMKAEEFEFFEEKKSEDDSIYSHEIMEEMLDNDELSASEEGFMLGYLEA